MVLNKTDKLPQTSANPTNAVFSEKLQRIPKILISKHSPAVKILEAVLKVVVIFNSKFETTPNEKNT